MFGMGAGNTVTPKKAAEPGGATLVHVIGSIEGASVTLVGTGESSDVIQTISTGELVDYYTRTEYVADIVVRAGDFKPIEEDAEVLTDFITSGIKCILYQTFRLHQPKTRVDLKLGGTKLKSCLRKSR